MSFCPKWSHPWTVCSAAAQEERSASCLCLVMRLPCFSSVKLLRPLNPPEKERKDPLVFLFPQFITVFPFLATLLTRMVLYPWFLTPWNGLRIWGCLEHGLSPVFEDPPPWWEAGPTSPQQKLKSLAFLAPLKVRHRQR